MEVSKIWQHRQRRDLRDVIQRVSPYRVITSRVMITKHEVESLLDEFVGPSSRPINEMDSLDWGVARAFGMVGGFRIKDRQTDEDVTDEVAAKHPGWLEAFYRKLASAELDVQPARGHLCRAPPKSRDPVEPPSMVEPVDSQTDRVLDRWQGWKLEHWED